MRGISLLVTKLQFCHAIAQEAPASGLERTPANGGITKIRSQTGPAGGGIGNEMERDQQYDTKRDTNENLDCF